MEVDRIYNKKKQKFIGTKKNFRKIFFKKIKN